MPKMKTRKAVKSKFKVTATGKLLQNHPGRRHKLAKKSSNRKRRLLKQSVVNKGQTKMYLHLMGVA